MYPHLLDHDGLPLRDLEAKGIAMEFTVQAMRDAKASVWIATPHRGR
jgi:hypothetical protein